MEKRDADEISDTLLTDEKSFVGSETSKSAKNKKIGLIVIVLFLVLGAIAAIFIIVMGHSQDGICPASIKLPLTKGATMKLGTSRVLDVAFFSGHDDRTSDDFKVVTQKQLIWNVSPEGIITVDQYGRVEAKALGKALLRVVSKVDDSVYDQQEIKVVEHKKMISESKRVVNYAGFPKTVKKNFRKIVDRYTKQEIAASVVVPQSIKDVSADPQSPSKKKSIKIGEVLWEIVDYADKSQRTYLKRTDKDQKAYERDRQQFFIGDRYLPGNGQSIISIEDDGNNGVWTVDQNGTGTHVRMKIMTLNEQAELMVQDTQKNVMRFGMASGSTWNGQKWVPQVSDNDGLWTSMYGAGELMRYASLKRQKSADNKIQKARSSALKSLKAVLLISNVAGRNKTVDAKLRRYNSSRIEPFLSADYLKKDKIYNVDNYPGSSADGIGFFGEFAGSTINDAFIGGSQKYTNKPVDPDDWITTGDAAYTKRTLNNYMARSFMIPAFEGEKPPGGLFFRRTETGMHKVLGDAHLLYDFKKDDHPELDLGYIEIPQVLRDLQKIDGRPLKGSDMIYKGDTSTDEVIGHMFIYKIAFDIMDQNDPEEKQLKQLIVETMVGLCQMFINNGYIMADATGQGTKWTRMHHDFFNSDYTLQDAPLKAIQTLLLFKLTYYLSGDPQWKYEYELLINHGSFKYADLASTLWDRWVWRAFNQDNSPKQGLYRLTQPKSHISQTELIRHVMYNDHYSDDQEALLAYYLIFQLEEDEQLLKKYKQGLNGYWHTICHSDTPLWYLIYQLTEPENTQLQDCLGRNLLESSAWGLSRFPMSTITYTAFVQGSRPDVIFEGDFSVNPNKILATRKSKKDEQYVNKTKNYEIVDTFDPKHIYEMHPLPQDERSLHKYNGVTYDRIDRGNPNVVEAATVFTLPYWLGVYHKMIEMDD